LAGGHHHEKKVQNFLQRTLKFPQDRPITVPDRQRTANIFQKICADRPKVGGKAAVNGRAGRVEQFAWSGNVENFFKQTLKLSRTLPLKRLEAIAAWQNRDKRVLLLCIIKVLSCTKQP
jgi:hypothetical protein